jgi:G3E family GTPase
VTVVTGFLGAGKTTLVNEWLGGVARGDIAVIVNEHGDIGIDGELLAARAQELIEITGGCICCKTQAELMRALDELASTPSRPKRVLVETSGAASPAGVLRAIALGGRNGAFALDGVVTVVDASRVDSLGAHDLAFEQLGYADVIVLSRADICSAGALEHATDVVTARNGAAVLVEAARGKLVATGSHTASGSAAPGATLDVLLGQRLTAQPRFRRAPAPGSSHVYESVALALDGDVDADRFADFVEAELGSVAGRIFRTKAILAVSGMEQRMIVQGVADSVEVSFGEPWGASPRCGRLVVVGFGLDREALSRGFSACAEASTDEP